MQWFNVTTDILITCAIIWFYFWFRPVKKTYDSIIKGQKEYIDSLKIDYKNISERIRLNEELTKKEAQAEIREFKEKQKAKTDFPTDFLTERYVTVLIAFVKILPHIRPEDRKQLIDFDKLPEVDKEAFGALFDRLQDVYLPLDPWLILRQKAAIHLLKEELGEKATGLSSTSPGSKKGY